MKAQVQSRMNDYTGWYSQVIRTADLAEPSGSRGSMIIKPYGFAIWEKIKEHLDSAIKATGHENVYFPLLIPSSFFSKEAEHIAGFAKECAVVTHYRLCADKDGKGVIPDPESRFEEPLIIRPTSETVIWDSFRRWIQSYRDLPLLVNQWANVVRMEMRPRPFLRTREILWQEGHTAHATEQEAREEARKMLQLYIDTMRDLLAIPVIAGTKTEHEKFSGAVTTYTIEALMQDKKVLQLGTSHFLGQNFSRAFGVKFSDDSGTPQAPWGTSWGVSTRLIGALIMTHGDEKGLILPPKVAPIQVVIILIYKKDEDREALLDYAKSVEKKLKDQRVRVQVDACPIQHPGWKFSHYECKGVPLRIVVGPRDVRDQTVEVTRRDDLKKITISFDQISDKISLCLEDIQKSLYERALAFQKENTHKVEHFDDFKKIISEQRGFISAPWDGKTSTELAIQNKTKATIRCIPFSDVNPEGKASLYSQDLAQHYALFGQAY